MPTCLDSDSVFVVVDVSFQPCVDATVATGDVQAGTFSVGDSVIVARDIVSKITRIEDVRRGEIPEANRGDRVAFHICGISLGLVKPGDTVFRRIQGN